MESHGVTEMDLCADIYHLTIKEICPHIKSSLLAFGADLLSLTTLETGELYSYRYSGANNLLIKKLKNAFANWPEDTELVTAETEINDRGFWKLEIVYSRGPDLYHYHRFIRSQ